MRSSMCIAVTLTMQASLKVLLLAAVVSAYPSHGSRSPDALIQAAKELRDLNSEGNNMFLLFYRRLYVFVLKQFDVDLVKDEDLERMMTSIADHAVTSQDELRAALSYRTPASSVAVSYLYNSLVNRIPYIISLVKLELLKYQAYVEFYEKTGYPTFPLKLSGSALRDVVQAAEPGVIDDIFYFAHVGDEADIRDRVLKALSESTSQEQFKDTFDVGYIDINNAVNYETKEFKTYRATVQVLEKWMNALEEYGLIDLPHGNPPMASLHTLADDAVDLTKLLFELYPDSKTFIAALNIPADEQGLHDWFYKFFSVDSKRGVYDLLPPNIAQEYEFYTFDLLMTLIDPSMLMTEVNNMVQSIELADVIGLPNFPLKGTRDQIAQLVDILVGDQPQDVKEEWLETLSNAESLYDAKRVSNVWALEDLIVKQSWGSGKTDLVDKIFLKSMRLAERLDAYGLL